MAKMSRKSTNVPNLRFEEFENEWKTKTLIELGDFMGGGTPSSANTSFWDGEIPWVSSSDLDENNIHSIRISRFINQDAINNSATKLCIAPVILIVSRVGVGKVAYSTKSLCTSQDFMNIVNLKCSGLFLSYLLSITMRKAASSSQGTSIKGIPSGEIKSQKLLIPQKNEQQKIASFLSLIDERISTQNKIIEGLTVLKATLSKKVFSQQFRFSEFNEDWKVIKLGEVLAIPEKIKPVHVDRDKLITVRLHLKGVLQNDNAETLSLGATNYFVRRKGQFIYGKQNLFNGAFGLVPDELDGFLSSADVPALEINCSKMNSLYLLYFLGRQDFYKRLEDIATGSGSKRIHEATLLNVEIALPPLEEQTKIANVLSAIGQMIELETTILNLFTKQKQYLLLQMFI